MPLKIRNNNTTANRFQEMRRQFEPKNVDAEANVSRPTAARRCQESKQLSKRELCQRFWSSPWIGFLVGPIIGVFIWYYFSCLILAGPPMELRVVQTDGKNVTLGLINDFQRHVIGGTAGGVTALFWAIGSRASLRIRCSMVLILPSLFAKRGRALMLSTAAGLLLSGPVNTIDYNVSEVTKAITCLYENVKGVAETYVVQIKDLWQQLKKIFSLINEIIAKFMAQLKELARKASEETRQEIEQAKEDLEKQVSALKEAMGPVKDILAAPNAVGDFGCDAGSWIANAGVDVGNFFKDDVKDFFVKDIGGLFGRRRKRGIEICDVNLVPDINVNLPDVRLTAIKEFIKKLKPDLDIIDFDFDGIRNPLQHSSIKDIRERLKNILKAVFETIRDYASYFEKIFYLTILLVLYDAFSYQRQYVADDAFDNMFIDQNLTRMWKKEGREKLVPLRNWEKKEKFQYGKSCRLSGAEVKRIGLELIPTLVFAVTAISLIVFDFSLVAILKILKREASFGISYEGMESGLSIDGLVQKLADVDTDIGLLKVRGFNLTTDECLPNARETSPSTVAAIVVLFTISGLSCLLDAYASRLRAKICNLFYSERAQQRANYLYKRILTGRASRRLQLSMTVRKELDRRIRRDMFCKLPFIENDRYKCPGCNIKMDKLKSKLLTVREDDGDRREIEICQDCHKDI